MNADQQSSRKQATVGCVATNAVIVVLGFALVIVLSKCAFTEISHLFY